MILNIEPSTELLEELTRIASQYPNFIRLGFRGRCFSESESNVSLHVTAWYGIEERPYRLPVTVTSAPSVAVLITKFYAKCEARFKAVAA
jgi:hypothetical protein